MSDLRNSLNIAAETDAATPVDIEKLSTLVEAQIDNVLGGGYSQYAAYHAKSAAN